MNVNPQFGEFLRRQRKNCNLTQKQLAELVSCSTITIAKIENGERRPSREMAQAIARVLGVCRADEQEFVEQARATSRPVVMVPRAEPESAALYQLPEQSTSFVGRLRELTVAVGKLRTPEVRLLTIGGAPGVGKSRLAQAIAHQLRRDFRDGVLYLALSEVAAAGQVGPMIASAFRREASDGVDLAVLLRERQLLLVLDGFEHLRGASPLLAHLLSTCPLLKILVTGRVPLYLRGENLIALAPLAIPPAGDHPAAELIESPAVRLFVERTKAVNWEFELTDDNALTVVELVRRLDGNALAIELAAGRTRFLGPQALLARIDSAQERDVAAPTLELLVAGPQDLPTHQRSMRCAIEWSYNLLGEVEKRLLRRLSVFSGGCSEQGASALAGDDAGEALAALVDAGLLLRYEAAGTGRYRMLRLIQEYGADQLRQSGEEAEAQTIHAALCRQIAAEAEAHLLGDQPELGMELLEEEIDNLHAAIQWLGRHLRIDEAAQIADAVKHAWSLRARLTASQPSPALSAGRRRNGTIADPDIEPRPAAIYSRRQTKKVS